MTELTEKRLDTLLETCFTYDPKITFRFDCAAKQAVTPLPFFVRYKAYLTAAAMVLATVISVSAFFVFGNKSAVPVAPSPPAAVATDAADATETPDSGKSQSETSAPNEAASASAVETQNATAATERSTDTQGNITVTVITDITTTEQDPPEDDHAEPSQKQSPTDAPTPASFEDPTHPATDPPHIDPVYQYDYYDFYHIHMQLVTEQPAMEFQQETTNDSYTARVRFISDALSEGDRLYCRIYDRRKNLWGDPDLYAEDHFAEFTVNGNTIRAIYTSDIHSQELSKDSHFFEFYDKYGRVLCVYELIPR